MEGARQRVLRAEPDEGEVQHGRPHLLADAATLVGEPQPRARGDLAQRGEVVGRRALLADDGAVDDDREGQVPVLDRPLGPLAPVPLGRSRSLLRRRDVGPRVGERHRGRVVDARAGPARRAPGRRRRRCSAA